MNSEKDNKDFANSVENLSFEEAMNELASIVTKLENGKESLENSTVLYERGMILQKHCRKKLEEAKLRVELVNKNGDGKISLEPTDTLF